MTILRPPASAPGGVPGDAGGAGTERRPVVSVILAVRNEAAYIEEAVRSLLQQAASDFELELLVIDGDSTDGTAEVVAALAENEPRIRLLHNPGRTAPCAFNVGLRAARGEYVCIFGAHTVYLRDYIAVCLRELRTHDAVGCSGRITTIPANRSLQARLVCWAMSSRFASSARSVRTHPEGYADTIPFPVVRKQALLEAGGYDEELVRNQDNDMNQKLRARGYQLYLTAKTECQYRARPTVQALAEYAYRSGFWNALTLKKRVASMSLRHFVPLAFVLSMVALLSVGMAGMAARSVYGPLALTLLLGVLVLHLALGFASAVPTGVRERAPAALVLPFVIFLFHFCYGWGTVVGLFSGHPHRAPVRTSQVARDEA